MTILVITFLWVGSVLIAYALGHEVGKVKSIRRHAEALDVLFSEWETYQTDNREESA